jgi:hypothetical protein
MHMCVMARRGQQHGNSAADSRRGKCRGMRPIMTPRSGRLIGFTKSQRFSRILGCDGMEPAEDEDDLSHFWWLLSLLVMKYQSSSCRSGSIPDLLAKFLLWRDLSRTSVVVLLPRHARNPSNHEYTPSLPTLCDPWHDVSSRQILTIRSSRF